MIRDIGALGLVRGVVLGWVYRSTLAAAPRGIPVSGFLGPPSEVTHPKDPSSGSEDPPMGPPARRCGGVAGSKPHYAAYNQDKGDQGGKVLADVVATTTSIYLVSDVFSETLIS